MNLTDGHRHEWRAIHNNHAHRVARDPALLQEGKFALCAAQGDRVCLSDKSHEAASAEYRQASGGEVRRKVEYHPVGHRAQRFQDGLCVGRSEFPVLLQDGALITAQHP